MTAQLYGLLPRILGFIVAGFSSISAALIWSFPAPEGLRTLDPLALRNTMVVILLVFGMAAPLAAVFGRAQKWLVPKAAIFAAAGFSHAAALGPEIRVPFQGATSAIAAVCSLGLTVLTLAAFMDSVQEKHRQGSVSEKRD
ncbi:hypothetical protein OOZ51_20625 [Arthrobacter sp. MI7-26]|uniref:hypothetical protein n=1 Tax=Arthrobacter sp. MI7-26 TaxID=2993653 RepID=UPI002248DAF5|nr:hypothetical protein [Arthrobacter sp. MI7-26]MCX2750192.1 hypothetical protein [Arthrobacter sp. MI7-26]